MLNSLSSFSSPGLQGDKSGVNLDHNVDDTEQVLEMFKEKPHKEGSTEVQSLTTGTRPKESQVKGTTFKIPTLQPYTTRDKAQPFVNPQRPRKTRFRPDPTLIHFDHLFGSESWARFLLIETSIAISATKLENILLTKCPSRDMSLRKIDNLNWLIETTNRNQSEIYLNLKVLDNIQVKVKRHDRLNSIFGTVILPNHDDDIDSNMLLDSLKKRYPNVEGLEIYEIPQRNLENSSFKIAKIKFEGQSLPTDVRIMGQKRELRPHIPKPLQCKKCSKFGHSTQKCRNDHICAFCGSSEHQTKWNCGEMKCINCGQNHHARSKVCQFYIYNTELRLLMDRSGMKVKEAKFELKVRGIKDPATTSQYNTIARQNAQQKPGGVNIPSTNKENIKGQEPDMKLKEDHAAMKLKNPFDALNINSEPDLETDNEMEIESTSKGTKRLRESNSPPKIEKDINSKSQKSVKDLEKLIKKNPASLEYLNDTDMTPSPMPQPEEDGVNSVDSASSKKRIIKLNRQASPESDLLDDIDPSPVFPSKYLNLMKNAKDKPENKKCECQKCSQKDNTPEMGNHHEQCGCNNCFIQDCKENEPLTKDRLRNIIRNFLSRKDSSSTTIPLELHPEDCMCIKHLHYYRTNKIKILDNLLAKQDNSNFPNEYSTDTEVSEIQTENQSAK